MMSFEGIVDRWLADHYSDYWVWSIPEEGWWTSKSYIITNDETLFAIIKENTIVPTTAYKDICDEISAYDPKFFEKLEYFITKADKRHNK